MLYSVMEMIFNNAILIILVVLGIYIYKLYKDLKNRELKIQEKFDKVLDKYLIARIDEAKAVIDKVKATYSQEDEAKTEINRLEMTVEKGMTGQINEKVETSNAINKFKLSEKIDLEKYPQLAELTKLGTFTEEDMESIDNGVAIARREYNALAFQYNEKVGEYPICLLVKLLKLNSHYIIFDPPKSKAYEEKYEVFEEEEPELNSITSMNQQTKVEEPKVEEPKPVEEKQIKIDHSNNILKPTFEVTTNENAEESDN